MVFEEERFIHEDLERLEQAVADRVTDEPRNVSRLSAFFRDYCYLTAGFDLDPEPAGSRP